MKPHPIALATGVVAILVAEPYSTPLPPPENPRVEIQPSAPLPSSGSKGVLEGKVLFAGAQIPQATQVENTTDPQGCGKLQSLENVIVSAKNQGIQNVIVVLQGVALPKDYRSQASRLILDNRECRFRPHAAVVTTGSSIEAVNSDPIFHSVHLYGVRNLNLALSPKSSKVVRRVKRPGFLIVKCDIHGWMQAFVRVDDHPFHSVSAADGRFRIAGIPPGSYTLEAWHEYFGSKETRVRVEAGSVSRVTLYYRTP
ncbi:MAG: carboxypeptidase regulatory-like domain-containing protein [Terriglobia bacterium]